MRIRVAEAAAATAVGTDIMIGHSQQVSGQYRLPLRIGVTGSNAVGAAEIELFAGQYSYGKFRNSTLGAVDPVDFKDMVPLRTSTAAEPGEPFRMIITAVSAANPLVVILETQEIGRRR